MGVSAFGKKFLIKDGMCRVENDIFLYVVYKVVLIVLIPNEYHLMNIINSEYGTSLLAQTSVGRNRLYSQKYKSTMFWVCSLRRSPKMFST